MIHTVDSGEFRVDASTFFSGEFFEISKNEATFFSQEEEAAAKKMPAVKGMYHFEEDEEGI